MVLRGDAVGLVDEYLRHGVLGEWLLRLNFHRWTRQPNGFEMRAYHGFKLLNATHGFAIGVICPKREHRFT
jgi:hypothetical protein